MTVTIKFFGAPRDTIGEKTIVREYDETTIRAALNELKTEFPSLKNELFDENGNPRESIHIMVNNKHVRHIDGTDTEVFDGDKITIASPITGG